MKPMLFLALILFWPLAAQGAVVVALQNQETAVAVNTKLGTILQLPSPVKTITPSQHFSIRDVGGADGRAKADVRTFHVRPVAGAAAESVTFVLASGKALALRLIPTPGGEKYYDIQLDASSRHGHDSKFLGPELSMMHAMLLDEPGGFARETMDQTVTTEFKGLQFSLVRLYGSSEVTGYVFTVQNHGSQALDLNLSSLAFAKPNRAVLAQADARRLEACPLLGSPTPACQTALRLVVKGPRLAAQTLGALQNVTPPFTKAVGSERSDK